MGSPTDVKYPDNLNIQDLYYFMLVPTLCYELNFPRTERIRKRFLFRRMMELVFGTQLVLALIQQWIIPTVKNSIVPFSNMNVIKICERLLKLAVSYNICFFICTVTSPNLEWQVGKPGNFFAVRKNFIFVCDRFQTTWYGSSAFTCFFIATWISSVSCSSLQIGNFTKIGGMRQVISTTPLKNLYGVPTKLGY